MTIRSSRFSSSLPPSGVPRFPVSAVGDCPGDPLVLAAVPSGVVRTAPGFTQVPVPRRAEQAEAISTSDPSLFARSCSPGQTGTVGASVVTASSSACERLGECPPLLGDYLDSTYTLEVALRRAPKAFIVQIAQIDWP